MPTVNQWFEGRPQTSIHVVRAGLIGVARLHIKVKIKSTAAAAAERSRTATNPVRGTAAFQNGPAGPWARINRLQIIRRWQPPTSSKRSHVVASPDQKARRITSPLGALPTAFIISVRRTRRGAGRGGFAQIAPVDPSARSLPFLRTEHHLPPSIAFLSSSAKLFAGPRHSAARYARASGAKPTIFGGRTNRPHILAGEVLR